MVYIYIHIEVDDGGEGSGMLGRSGFFPPRPDAILIKCWRMPVSRKTRTTATLPMARIAGE